jgi:hypothetical protein
MTFMVLETAIVAALPWQKVQFAVVAAAIIAP